MGGMTCRIGPSDAGLEPGPPAARTIASTDGAGALPTELNTTPTVGFKEGVKIIMRHSATKETKKKTFKLIVS